MTVVVPDLERPVVVFFTEVVTVGDVIIASTSAACVYEY
jgi:hypothetical protein